MKKHIFLLVLIAVFFSCKSIISKQKQTKIQKPNIIFILTDDQRFDAIGYAGNKYVETPEMDNLAKAGTYFKNAIVTTPICAASRASILTGLYERSHNFNFQTGNIREEYMVNSYPALLKKNGYYTGFFGKYGVRSDDMDNQFDVYESYDRNNKYKDKRGYFYKTIENDTVHLTRYTGQKAVDFIDDSSTNKPFCLSLSFSAPHAHDPSEDQYFWQAETDMLLANTIISDPALGNDKYFYEQPEIVRNGFNRLRWKWRYDTPEKYQHSLKGYYRMISGIDLEITKIREKLKEKGLDKNTVIIVMGDNGCFLGERQLAGKWLMYDNSIRVPLIVFDPRIKKHQDVDDLALNIDVAPTIADIARVKLPSTWQGKSLMPIVKQETNTVGRDTILIEHIWDFSKIPPSEGVRTKGWKYFRYINDKTIEELYNLKEDPKEIKNLIHDKKYQKIAAKLSAKCDELIKKNSNKYRSAPTDLTTELIRKPNGEVKIIDTKPEFGWTVAKESKSQSGYQILVASSKASLDNNIGDVWDSKHLRSSTSTNVAYDGNPLAKGKTYFWKVRTWDSENRLVDYSDVQQFSIGKSDNSMITTANSFQIDRVKPIQTKKIVKDSYFLDFGKAAFANVEFKYETKVNDTLIVRIGEQLEASKINRKPKGTIRYQEMKIPVNPEQSNYSLPIKPDKRNTKPMAIKMPDSFPVLMPFRYLEIDNFKQNFVADNFTQLAYHSYWEDDTSTFKSSNELLNQVWDLCKYSIKATTFAGLYVDGDRERIPYEADAYLNQLSHYTTDREYAMARQTIEYFMEYPTWPTEWQLHVALMFYADYMYTGNTELIETYYDDLKYKTLMDLRREDGLISSSKATPEFMKKLGFKNSKKKLKDIVDWPPAQKDTGWKLATKEGERDGFVFTPINTVVNCFYYRNLEIMAEFAEILNKTDEAEEFQQLAAKVKGTINDKLLDKSLGIYTDGEGTRHASLHSNMMALAFDLVPQKYMQSVVDFVKSRGMGCSVYGAQYLLEALYNAGESSYALELMTATHDRSWQNMIKIGSTITLEAWDMRYKPNADWNHAWGAAPANIIPRHLWGITPKTPGYGTTLIQPQLGELKTSSIVVPTIRGQIRANYTLQADNTKSYTIEIPANMNLEFIVNPNSKIKVNSKMKSSKTGVVSLKSGQHSIEVY